MYIVYLQSNQLITQYTYMGNNKPLPYQTHRHKHTYKAYTHTRTHAHQLLSIWFVWILKFPKTFLLAIYHDDFHLFPNELLHQQPVILIVEVAVAVSETHTHTQTHMRIHGTQYGCGNSMPHGASRSMSIYAATTTTTTVTIKTAVITKTTKATTKTTLKQTNRQWIVEQRT